MNNFNYNPTTSEPAAHEQPAFQPGGTHRETVPNPPPRPQQSPSQHWPFSGSGVPYRMPPPQSHFRLPYGMAPDPSLSPLSHQYSIGSGLNPCPQGYLPGSPQYGMHPSPSPLSPPTLQNPQYGMRPGHVMPQPEYTRLSVMPPPPEFDRMWQPFPSESRGTPQAFQRSSVTPAAPVATPSRRSSVTPAPVATPPRRSDSVTPAPVAPFTPSRSSATSAPAVTPASAVTPAPASTPTCKPKP
jgi:hypothetical protein